MLIRELKAQDNQIIVEGLGGPAMSAAGAMVHYDTVQRAAMGWKGALRYFELTRMLKWTRNHFRQRLPDLLVCIDSWSMNWHWAQLAHGMGIPVLYYVAPQMWASRPWRVKKLRRYVDRIACILPFEEKFFQDRGVEATFVGHPLFDQLPAVQPIEPEKSFPQPTPGDRRCSRLARWGGEGKLPQLAGGMRPDRRIISQSAVPRSDNARDA